MTRLQALDFWSELGNRADCLYFMDQTNKWESDYGGKCDVCGNAKSLDEIAPGVECGWKAGYICLDCSPRLAIKKECDFWFKLADAEFHKIMNLHEQPNPSDDELKICRANHALLVRRFRDARKRLYSSK